MNLPPATNPFLLAEAAEIVRRHAACEAAACLSARDERHQLHRQWRHEWALDTADRLDSATDAARALAALLDLAGRHQRRAVRAATRARVLFVVTPLTWAMRTLAADGDPEFTLRAAPVRRPADLSVSRFLA